MKKIKIALLGNPNSGKSTLFNTLTGATQAVGNWPGVTVERKSGYFTANGVTIEIVDLPGVYSLSQIEGSSSLDAKIACEAILSGEFDGVVNIVDLCSLERNLYLTAQLADMQIPVVVAANMMDIAKKRGISLDVAAFAEALGCPVVPVTATQPSSVSGLKQVIAQMCVSDHKPVMARFVTYPLVLQEGIETLKKNLLPKKLNDFQALQLLEADSASLKNIEKNSVAILQQQVQDSCQEEVDILVADARYSAIHRIKQSVVQKHAVSQQTFTQRLDKIVLNRFLGIPIFLLMMYLMFLFAINIGGAFQPFFDIGSEAIFVQGFAQTLQFFQVPVFIATLLAGGIGAGINTIVTFIPVIGALFLFLSLLESSGYMARAAFVVDRGMRAMGLPGKSFVPLIVGFGCNVPAILAARTLENRSDRLLTMMMTPFMSCGARLAIYAVFSTVFFPHSGQNVVFALYVIGILIAVMTGFILRNTLLQGKSAPLILELPAYHKPVWTVLLRQAWQRLKYFLWGAGKFIIPMCLCINLLNMVSIQGNVQPASPNNDSVLAELGKAVTPVFSPLGVTTDNWPATVGLLTGVLAKEVVVGTLNTLYSQQANLQIVEEKSSVGQKLQQALYSIPEQLGDLQKSFMNPLAASAGDASINSGVIGVMYHHFDGPLGAMAYLLFILLYFPCVSAVAALIQESSLRWGIFSMGWTTGLAYTVAVIFYQLVTWSRHPWSSALWVSGLLLLFACVVKIMRSYAAAPIAQTVEQQTC